MELVIIDKAKRHSYKYSNISACSASDGKFAIWVDYFALSEDERCEDLIDKYDTLDRAKEVLEAIVKQQAELNAAVALANSSCSEEVIPVRYELIQKLSVFYMPEE